MSANRSVQAAQRRRAGQPEPQQVSRPPQPSINSSQIFSGQQSNMRPNPNSNPGRVSAQQYNSQSQSQSQSQGPPTNEGITGISKMTIAQAITLITLRLGALETKLIQLDLNPEQQVYSNGMDQDLVLIEKSVLDNITTRLESLEKRSTTNGSTDNSLIKQQIEVIKTTLIQTKNSTVSLSKDNKEFKQQIERLFQELNESRELIENVIKNSQQEEEEEIDNILFHNQDILNEQVEELEEEVKLNNDEQLLGDDLKDLLKNEINATI